MICHYSPILQNKAFLIERACYPRRQVFFEFPHIGHEPQLVPRTSRTRVQY
jgi:hypothetical protein